MLNLLQKKKVLIRPSVGIGVVLAALVLGVDLDIEVDALLDLFDSIFILENGPYNPGTG